MEDQEEQKFKLGNHSENESETSESSAETETTQVSSKKSKSRKRSTQNRILSKLTKLMEQMKTLTNLGTNTRGSRKRAGSNSSTEELTDTSSLDSEVLLNFKDNTTEPSHMDVRYELPQPSAETEPVTPHGITKHNPHIEQNTTRSHTNNVRYELPQPPAETETVTPTGITKQNHVKQNRTSAEPRTEPSFTTRPHIMPDKFDGSSDWVDYETHFDSCRTINNWTDAESVRYLSASLRGPALRLLNERRHSEWTYNDLKSNLSKRFSSSKQAESYLLELRSRKRRPNESLQELGRNIRELTTKAYPDFDSDGIDRLAKIHFTDAIQNPDIRTGIFHSKAKTLDEMIEAAITTETFHITESQRAWRKNTHNRSVEVEQPSQRDLQRTIDRAVEKAVRQAMSAENETNTRSRSNQNKQPRTITCFYCNKSGHSEANCFRKQSDLRQQTQSQQRVQAQRNEHLENLTRNMRQSNQTRPPPRAMARPNAQ